VRVFVAILVLLLAPSSAAAQDHDHPYVPPAPGVLGGAFSLHDQSGAEFTDANLRGRWTMLYFGYSRCRSACPVALPALAGASETLHERGVSARAVFVDIDAAPAPIRLRSEAAHDGGHQHAGDAIAPLADAFRNVTFLSGSRGQIRQALTAFRVRTEHVPARTDLGESGHSINHTTAIYVIGPDGVVVGYVYHTVAPGELAAYVERRAHE